MKKNINISIIFILLLIISLFFACNKNSDNQDKVSLEGDKKNSETKQTPNTDVDKEKNAGKNTENKIEPKNDDSSTNNSKESNNTIINTDVKENKDFAGINDLEDLININCDLVLCVQDFKKLFEKLNLNKFRTSIPDIDKLGKKAKALFDIDFLDIKELEKAGLDTSKPLKFFIFDVTKGKSSKVYVGFSIINKENFMKSVSNMVKSANKDNKLLERDVNTQTIFKITSKDELQILGGIVFNNKVILGVDFNEEYINSVTKKPTLKKDDSYRKYSKNLANNLAFLWINPEFIKTLAFLFSKSPVEQKISKDFFDSINGVGISMNLEKSSLEDKVVIELNEKGLLYNLFSFTKSQVNVFEMLSKNPLIIFKAQLNVQYLLSYITNILKDLKQNDPIDLLQNSVYNYGIDLKRDIIQNLSGEFTFVFYNLNYTSKNFNDFDFFIFTSLKDSKVFTNAIDNFFNTLKDAVKINLEVNNKPNLKAYTITSQNGNFNFGVFKDYFVVAPSKQKLLALMASFEKTNTQDNLIAFMNSIKIKGVIKENSPFIVYFNLRKYFQEKGNNFFPGIGSDKDFKVLKELGLDNFYAYIKYEDKYLNINLGIETKENEDLILNLLKVAKSYTEKF